MGVRVKIIVEPSALQLATCSFYLVKDYENADAAEAAAISFIAKREYDPQKLGADGYVRNAK